ncbi:MAG TPA: HAD-IC family P-type ATPase [Streptosporangiaceae bacterium]|nr:HAD-IC family P-type ATPase [Streptosporangiaceae bacterium]
MGLGLLRRGLSRIPNVPGGGLITESAGWAVRHGGGAVRQSTQLAWQSTQLAWQGAWLASTPVRQTASALATLPGELPGVLPDGLTECLADELAGPRRRVWTYPDRVHVRLRCSYGPAAQRRRATIERTLEAHPGVTWARVNHALGRVIIGLADPPAEIEEIVALLEALDAPGKQETEAGADGRAEAAAEAYADKVGRRPPLGLLLATDAGGLVATAAEWLFRRAPMPPEVAGAISFVDNIPRLRAMVERAVPGQWAATWFPMVSAVAQGLAPGGTGLVIDVAQRLSQLREAQATTAAWARAEHELTGTPDQAGAEPAAVERPCALPPGPVERYADQALAGGLAGGLVGGLVTGGIRRGVQAVMAASPKAAAAGREIYAAELGARLARRGVIVCDQRALRRLDRIDTALLDAAALRSGRFAIGDVIMIGDADHDEVATRLYALFDAADPGRVADHEGWRLGPVEELRVPGRAGKREANRLRGGTTAYVLALTFEQRPRAMVAAIRRQAPEVNALVTAVRRAGLRLAVAGDDLDLASTPDAVVPGGSQLVASVRQLQSDGAGVLLVSGHGAALAAADCGVGVTAPGGLPPWGAHLLVGGHDLAVAARVIDAARAARRVSERGVTLARSGSGVAGLFALTGPAGRSGSQVMSAVNVAAALSMGYAGWQARGAVRRPLAPPSATTPWHAMPVGAVLDELRTRRTGLTDEEARTRRPARAEPGGARWGLLKTTADELANPLTPVLAAGAVGSAAVGSMADAALVAGVMGLSALVGGVQRLATDKTIARLSPRSTTAARVSRAGEEREVDGDRLVPGDVVRLAAGDVVPADCRILDADGLEADESSLTGESLPVAKSNRAAFARQVAERSSMLYEGTVVAAGEARAVVVAVGDATETGRALAASADNGDAPLSGVEARLAKITDATLPLAVGSALGVAGSGFAYGNELRQALSEGVSLAVASVPEGLPLLVSAAQLAATRRLSTHGVYVRNPRTIEALGRVDVLCFDKTGTLTEGEIKLARVSDERHEADLDHLDDPLRGVIVTAVRATPHAENGNHAHVTDAAVDEGAAAAGVRRRADANGWEELAGLRFEPSRAYHATLGRAGKERLVSVKGAPEVVLPRCVRTRDGAELDEQSRRDIEARIERLAGSGHRVLAVAERTRRGSAGGNPGGANPGGGNPGGGNPGGAGDDAEGLTDDDVADLTFVGLLGLADVLRETAVPAIAGLRDAGIQIVMLTGDHPSTAGAIASNVSDTEHQHVITGDEIDSLDDDELAAALADVDVVARCTPTHKVRVVQAFQNLGRTVAMTGDGANDAAGIRLADVGIALGRRGTAAAKAAADMIVADDKLETIISALVEGRAMWASVRQALAILVGGNLGEIGFTLVGSLTGGSSPLSARQLLLVNMLTDLAPALAIAIREPRPEAVLSLLGEGPESSLGGALTRGIAHRAVVTALGAGTGWTIGRFTGPAIRARTIGLVALVGTQLAQTLAAGGRDRAVLLSAVGSALVLAAIVQTPVLSTFFGCVPLDPLGWAIALGAIAAAVSGGRLVPGASGRPAG